MYTIIPKVIVIFLKIDLKQYPIIYKKENIKNEDIKS
jgi:hypothetical protein